MKISYSITVLTLFLSVSSSLLMGGVQVQVQASNDGLCFGKEEVATKLDFFNSVLTTNTLEQPGGIIRYEDIGIVRDRKVDLVVSVAEGTTYYSNKASKKNGLNGKFGLINIMNLKNNAAQDGNGNFDFCFYDHENGDLTTVDSFRWSFYDIDERNEADNGIKEKIRLDTNQITDFILYPNEQESEVILSCDDGTTTLPCKDGVRTVFHSSTKGTGPDNPSDPDNLTEQQKKRSIVFTFKDTSCFTVTLDHYCPVDKCRWYGGGNFMFSGDADEIIEKGECITSPPIETSSPTKNPTVSPTINPTMEPTMDPTSPPTIETTTDLDKNGAGTDDGDFFLPPICPDDVKLIKQQGVTPFPDDTASAVRIVSQDTSTVTVKLEQAWMSSSVIDYIYYEYKEDLFDLKCYEEVDVGINTSYDTITIQCNVMNPRAHLQICLADDFSKDFLGFEDDGTVPKCCHSNTPAETPTVCYTLEINCETGCAEARRNLLRGGSFY